MCQLFRLDRLSITNPFSHFPVPLFPISRFPVLQFGAAFSSLTFSARRMTPGHHEEALRDAKSPHGKTARRDVIRPFAVQTNSMTPCRSVERQRDAVIPRDAVYLHARSKSSGSYRNFEVVKREVG